MLRSKEYSDRSGALIVERSAFVYKVGSARKRTLLSDGGIGGGKETSDVGSVEEGIW